MHLHNIYATRRTGWIQGAFRTVAPPKTQSDLFAPQKTVDGCAIFASLDDFFYRYRYECHRYKSLALPDRLFLRFFSSNFQNCLRNPNIVTHPGSNQNKLSCIKNAHFSSTTKISASVIFSIISGGPPGRWHVGHLYLLFFESEFGLLPKSGLNPWSF